MSPSTRPVSRATRPDDPSLQDGLEQARLGIITADDQRLWNLSLVGCGTMGRSVTRVMLAASAIDIEKQKLSLGRSTAFRVQSLETPYTASLRQELAAETAYAMSLTQFDRQLGTTLETRKISIAEE